MCVRGVRGATVVSQDESEAILIATQELLEALVKANPQMRAEEIASAIFTLTDDLSTAYPAVAARRMGWNQAPLMCAREVSVPDSLPRCIRVLLHWNTSLPQSAIQHVYLGAAASLRPDLAVSLITEKSDGQNKP